MARLLTLIAVVVFSGCQCTHLIGELTDAGDGSVPESCVGDAGPTGCRAYPTDGGLVLCPYGDRVGLENQPCAQAGQVCRSSACSPNLCSTGCFEGVCDPAACAWRGRKPAAAECGDAGACKYPAECPTVIGATCAFSTGVTTVPSCIEQRCLEECPGNRVCTVGPSDGGLCLTCGGGVPDCATQCGLAQSGSVTIDSIQCEPGFDAGVLGLPLGFQPSTPASCRYDLAPLGWMMHLSSANSLADFPALGGTCTGRNLATGAPRTQWFCPRCSFVMLGWE